jgi:hypothetical protein
VHTHALAADGVFTEAADGTLRFHPAPLPTDAEVARLVPTIRIRLRLLRPGGVFIEAEDDEAPDPLAEASLPSPASRVQPSRAAVPLAREPGHGCCRSGACRARPG